MPRAIGLLLGAVLVILAAAPAGRCSRRDAGVTSPASPTGTPGSATCGCSRPGRLSAALGQYRALHRDAADNRRGLTAPLPMPVLALGGDRAAAGTADSLRQVARDVRTVVVPGAGHYLPEERPAEFAGAVLDLLARPE